MHISLAFFFFFFFFFFFVSSLVFWVLRGGGGGCLKYLANCVCFSFLWFFFFFFFFFFRAAPVAYRSSRAGGQVRSTDAGLGHGHGIMVSEACL